MTAGDGVDNLFRRTVETVGGVDVLVNNAGVTPSAAMGLPETLAGDAIDTTVAVNLWGLLTFVRATAHTSTPGASS